MKGKKRIYAIKECNVCGPSNNKVYFHKDLGVSVCSRHAYHLKKYGRVLSDEEAKAKSSGKGSKRSEETKKKMSLAHKGNKHGFQKGKGIWNGKKRPNVSGEKCNFWKGGISTYERKLYLNLRRRTMKLKADGLHLEDEWKNLKAQYNWTCPSCRKSEPQIKLTEDHIIPLSKGGSDNIENIQPLCKSCNSRKYNKIIKYKYA